ncbi:hypothetical protein TH25_01615 [Thalassospira profundimaris]|uniref:asparagine synthase (glutamine-hydrolyzing) n=1 Tax=Thalassospira profundimaris TaxID=502049 RepID=A0A367XK77_9PROT|nr:hypothetical protein [Thalassospira profundimaris]RCK54067.1 hypothetical protein TH25_01615 [Thalassospira profundimaris]
MIKYFNEPDSEIEISSDIGGGEPIYIYISPDRTFAIYSSSLKDIVSNHKKEILLKIDRKAISFLLQNGVIPPPNTVFCNLFLISIETTATLKKNEGIITLTTRNNKNLIKNSYADNPDGHYNDRDLLETLYSAITKKLDKGKENYLFHSAGKDSNALAIAIAEAGAQDRFTLITNKSTNDANLDESNLSAQIAQKLGFKHHILHQPKELGLKHLEEIENFFAHAPLPCTDPVSLAYPLYYSNYPFLAKSNLLDGMGNDIYLGHIPGKIEYKFQNISNILQHGRLSSLPIRSEGKFNSLTRSRPEWTGLIGFTHKESKSIFPESFNTREYWKNQDLPQNYFLFRSAVRGKIIDQEIYMRKVRNFGDVYNSNILFPWTDENLISYCMKIPKHLKYDEKNLRNKIFLRNLVNSKTSVDPDKIGKRTYFFEIKRIIKQNENYFSKTIKNCRLFSGRETATIADRLFLNLQRDNRESYFSSILINQLFLIAKWLESRT